MRARFRWSVGLTVALLAATPLVVLFAPPAPAQPAKKVPAGMELVPTEGFAFVTINVGKVYDAEVLKPFRDSLVKGDKAFLKRLEADTGLTPEQLDRVTAFLPSASYTLVDVPLYFVTTRKPIDKAKLFAAWKATVEPKGPVYQMPGGAQIGNLGGQFGLAGGGGPPPVPAQAEPQPPKPKDEKVKEKPLDLNAPMYYTGDHGEMVLVPIDDRNLVFMSQTFGTGNPMLVAALLRRKADGPLAEAIALADQHHVVAMVEGKHLRETLKLWREVPTEAMPLVEGNDVPPPKPEKKPDDKIEDEFTPYEPLFQLDRATLTLDLGVKTKLTVIAHFATPGEAGKAEPVAKEGLKGLLKALQDERKAADTPEDKDLLPLFDFAAGGLEAASVRADGKTLVVTATAEVGGALKTAMLTLPQKLQEAADRMRTHNNLRQIGLAILNFESANGHLPQDVMDSDGKPLLSWRVELLPYLEANDLFAQIDRNKAWDDPAHKKLWDKMPDALKVSGREAKEKHETYFQVFRAVNWVGHDDAWMVDTRQVTSAMDVTDGTANTAAVFEMETAVNWMKPGDNLLDPKKLAAIGNPKTGKANVVMLDGSVHALDRKKYVGEKLRAIITVNGGEDVDLGNGNGNR